MNVSFCPIHSPILLFNFYRYLIIKHLWFSKTSKYNLNKFSSYNFSCMFLNPIIFSNLNSNWSNFLYLRNLQEQVKKSILLLEIVLTFHCLNRLFMWSQKVCKFSAFSLEFQKIFSITRTIFSNSERSEQFLVTECFFNLFLEVSQI